MEHLNKELLQRIVDTPGTQSQINMEEINEKDDEIKALKEEIEWLKKEIEFLNGQITEIEKENDDYEYELDEKNDEIQKLEDRIIEELEDQPASSISTEYLINELENRNYIIAGNGYGSLEDLLYMCVKKDTRRFLTTEQLIEEIKGKL